MFFTVASFAPTCALVRSAAGERVVGSTLIPNAYLVALMLRLMYKASFCSSCGPTLNLCTDAGTIAPATIETRMRSPRPRIGNAQIR